MKDMNHIRKEIPFDKYNFKRKEFKETDLPYLMGNNEMGGLVSNMGLGFEKLYFSDVWDTEKSRMALPGPMICNSLINETLLSKAVFQNELTLKEGVLKTEVNYHDKVVYNSEIFFSKQNRHLLCIRIEHEMCNESKWTIRLPLDGFEVKTFEKGLNGISSNSELFSKIAWSLSSPNRLLLTNNNEVEIYVENSEAIELYYSVTTQFDGDNYIELSKENVIKHSCFSKLKEELVEFSDKEFKEIASIILPEGDYAKWFYRSIFILYNTSGSEHFLPAELHFSKPSPNWNGHPFTYGQGGWGVFAFTFLGAFSKAENMAKWHYKKDVLKQNVNIIFPEKGEIDVFFKDDYKGKHNYIEENNQDALSFGHELTAEGFNIPISHTLGKYSMHWDWQMHLNSFAASFFHVLSNYKDDKRFIENYTYPVLKGTAELWCLLLNWDNVREIWYLPPLLSVSENLLEKSVLDAIIGARWNLKVAANYALKLKCDQKLAKKWEKIASQIYIPQNSTNYLEYLDDDEKREGGGYFGIRAPMSLAFPYLELLPEINKEKARITLDRAWNRNNEGQGMIAYVSNWFALTESYLGFKDKAFKMASFILSNVDPSGVALCEAYEYEDNDNKKGDWIPKFPYYLTGYSAFICASISFLIQSKNGVITVFPGIPEKWSDIEFYDLPAESGITVSAKLENKKVVWVEFKRDQKILLTLNTSQQVRVENIDNSIVLTPLSK